MGFFSGISHALGGIVGSVLGGGGGGGSASSSQSTSNTTNVTTDVNVDLEPLGRILAKSQEQTAQVFTHGINQISRISANGLNQVAKTEKEAQKINLINGELNRQVELSKQHKLDTYLEHAKNGLVLSSVVVALLYVSKKGKKNAK